jgi:hypothetical protein
MSLGQHYAQAMLFGPDGELLVPITGDGVDSGSVRAYNVATKSFSTFVPSGSGALFNPWFLTFTQTNPATLAYQPWHNFVNSVDVDGSGQLIPLDALLVINELNQRTVSNAQGTLPNSRSTSTYYYDVTSDGNVFPIDALQVINALNTVGIGEGERQSLLSTTSSAATVLPLESTITVRTAPSPAAPRALAINSGEPKPAGVAADQLASTNFRSNAMPSTDRRPHAGTVEPSTRVQPTEVAVPEPVGPIAPQPWS